MDNVNVFTSEASRCLDVAYPIIGEVYFLVFIEAKQNNFMEGWEQCVAGLLAALKD